MKLTLAVLERNQVRNKKLCNRKAKKRVLQVGDKILVLYPTDHNELLMQRKSPIEVKGCKGGKNYQIKINEKMMTFYINLLKPYVEKENVEMTATHGRRKETRMGTEIKVHGFQEAAVDTIAKIVVGSSADYVKEQGDVSVKDEKIFKVGVLRPKESINDVCLRVELSR